MSKEKLLRLSRERKLLALRLRRRLREMGLTQDRAAEMAGVSKRTMEYWLAGRGPIRKTVLQAFGCASPASFAVTTAP
jgi:transcriptional regulator with XRE-family HTH domain